MTKTIIGLVGPMGVGKTTVATLLRERHGFMVEPFAAPLKKMLAALLYHQGVTQSTVTEMLAGDAKETPSVYLAGASPRRAMQTLGTEWRDTIDRNLWTQIWRGRVKLMGNRSVVVDDMRFLHEAEAIRAMGGKVFRISRPDRIHEYTMHPAHPAWHLSEQEWERIEPDGILVNREGNAVQVLDQMRDLGIPLSPAPSDVPLPL